MKIVFTGSGTGGHFYPNIAVAEAIRAIARERRLLMPRLYYLAPKAFDQEALFENEIVHITCPAGKWRRYFSLQNFSDLFVTFTGYICALVHLFRIYPDVVFSKGGYASVPVVLAAKTIGIPIVIHESDLAPGRANKLAASFATRIAVTFEGTAKYFPEKVRDRIARTGVPIRAALAYPENEGADEELHLDPSVPTLFILGGSLGAQRLNDIVVTALPELTTLANVIHQTGKDNFKGVEMLAKVVLQKGGNPARYHPFPFLSVLSLRRSAGAAELILSRAGMTNIAEIALWKKPAILVPIPESISHDQRANAYAYAETGAAIVIEEGNLTPNLLISEVKRLFADEALRKSMGEKSASFANVDAAVIIADELISIGLSHEK